MSADNSEAERDLIRFLHEPATGRALRHGIATLHALDVRGSCEKCEEGLPHLRTLLSKLDALGDAGTDDGGQP